MRLDDLIRETHKTALLQQKESGAALLLLQASIRKRNPDTSASASAAIVPGLLLALLVLASSKVGKSHDVGNPYSVVRAVRCGSKASVRTDRPSSHHTEMLLFGKLTLPRTAIHAAFDQLEPIDVPP